MGQQIKTSQIGNAQVTTPKITNPYKFSVYKSASQTGNADNATVKVTFNTELFDTNNDFDNATNYRYTAPVDGFYCFNVHALFNSSGNNIVAGTIFIYKNNSALLRIGGGYPKNGAGEQNTYDCSGSEVLELAAGDYIEIFATCDVISGTWGIVGGTNYTRFNGYLLSET